MGREKSSDLFFPDAGEPESRKDLMRQWSQQNRASARSPSGNGKSQNAQFFMVSLCHSDS